jgi:hypothetical protein
MVTTNIHITTLTPRTITRARGLAAYEAFRSQFHGQESVEIDLSGEYPLSLSFLDEFIRHLADARCLDRITFRVKGHETLRKLARVAEIRHVSIWYRDADNPSKKEVQPLPATQTESVFLEVKPEEDNS